MTQSHYVIAYVYYVYIELLEWIRLTFMNLIETCSRIMWFQLPKFPLTQVLVGNFCISFVIRTFPLTGIFHSVIFFHILKCASSQGIAM